MGAVVSFAVAVAFAAGLNVYATAATLGLLARLHYVALPVGLEPLAQTWVIACAVALFLCGVFADKIPFVDLIWNFAHTFVRVPVAALLGWRASSQLSPGMQVGVVMASAAIAMLSHGAKTGARTMVTASPEPFSNAALSVGEDAVSVGLTWLATKHPVAAGAAAVVMAVGIVLAARLLWGGLKRGWGRLVADVSGGVAGGPTHRELPR